MRKRFQYGNLHLRGDSWVGQWWEGERRRKRVLGRRPAMNKTQAQAALAALLLPVNAGQARLADQWLFGDFVRQVYLPFFRRKWKRSTALCNEDRIRHHLNPDFEARKLRAFDREELQAFLDRKADDGLSFSIVDHLRWDLRQIFRMALDEQILTRNPAELLFTPRECPRPNTAVMTREEVQKVLSVLAIRERLIARLAIVAGMRPGEIFALKWGRLEREFADIRERVYRGDMDTPKTPKSVRWAALSDGLVAAIAEWRDIAIDRSPEAWVLPSERGNTPLSKDNCWRRHFKPHLEAVGLGWVNFQVMRKTHNCLLKDLDVDPKVRAEQMGHSVDVNENVYTQSSLARRREAVNRLETSLWIN